MKKLFSIFLLAAAALSADPATTQITLVNAGDPQVSDGADYVGPYTLSMNGQNYAALCVDFNHNVGSGDTWTAYVNTINDYSKVYDSSNPTAYLAEAYLYTLITKPEVSEADRISIQHAAWNLTQGYDIHSDSAALNFVQLAQDNFMNLNLSDFQVLSDVNCTKQEFLVAAPEPSSFATLGGGLLLGIGLIRRNRKKAASSSQIS